MKKTGLILCGLCLGLSNLSAQVTQNAVPSMAGWNYYGGDEFNGNKIDESKWGVYGDPKYNYKFDDYGNTEGQGGVQYYRADMVKVKNGVAYITASREPLLTGRRPDAKKDPAGTDYSVKVQPPFKPKHDFGKYGWWSGALSSRNANGADLVKDKGLVHGTYYPLYSRIEVKAKIPYEFGTWMALWLRHCNGASTFEIDLQEFFVNEDRKDAMKEKGFYLHQTTHGMDYNAGWKNGYPNNTYNHNDYGDRVREIDFDPGKDFHVYGAQIDPEPGDPMHLAVTFLLDGRVRSVFRTKDNRYKSKNSKYPYRYNALLAQNLSKYGEDRVWDVAITGQVGGKAWKANTEILPSMYPYKGFGGTLYPELNPKYGGDINKVPKEFVTEIDWLRVFKRANELLWIGNLPEYRQNQKKSLELAKEKFTNIKPGDQLVMDLEVCDPNQKASLDIFNKSGKAITTLKPELAKNDAQVTFVVTEALSKLLKSEGCVLQGENIRLYTVCHSSKKDAIWSGFKEIQWGETIIPAELFANLGEGQKLEFVVRDVNPGGKIFLRQNKKNPTDSKRPKFSFSAQYGSIINLDSGKDEKTYSLDLEPKVIEELKQNGLVVTGLGYYLRSVNIIGTSHTSNNTVTGIAIDKIDSANQNDGTVYSINGMKVRDANDKGKLNPGIYIINGKKVLVK